jgi:hypothetical protein
MDERLARLRAYPRFKESTKPGEAFIIVRAKPSVAQKPQAVDTPPHCDGLVYVDKLSTDSSALSRPPPRSGAGKP